MGPAHIQYSIIIGYSPFFTVICGILSGILYLSSDGFVPNAGAKGVTLTLVRALAHLAHRLQKYPLAMTSSSPWEMTHL